VTERISVGPRESPRREARRLARWAARPVVVHNPWNLAFPAWVLMWGSLPVGCGCRSLIGGEGATRVAVVEALWEARPYATLKEEDHPAFHDGVLVCFPLRSSVGVDAGVSFSVGSRRLVGLRLR